MCLLGKIHSSILAGISPAIERNTIFPIIRDEKKVPRLTARDPGGRKIFIFSGHS
jgi:hypothetical protein